MSIAGTWYNELGSVMNLEVNGSVLTGTYQTAVGDAEGIYNLTGGVDTSPLAGKQAVGFVVAWVNQYGSSNSATAWSGQYQTMEGIEEIQTQWLLTQETSPEDDWLSTLVNHDVFTRTAPTPEQVARRKKRGSAPHPPARRS